MGKRREVARAGGHHPCPGGGSPGEGDVDDRPRSAPGSRGGGPADRSRPPSSSGGDPGGRIPRSPPVGCPGEVPAEAPPPAGTSPGLPGRRHITAAARGKAPGGGGLSTGSNRRGVCAEGGFEGHGGGDRKPAPRAQRPPPHRPGPRGWRPRGRRPTRVPAAFDPSSPGASRSRQTSAPSRPDGRVSRGTVSPSPVQPSDFLSLSFNL
jgi:hypothetical protein